MQALSATDLFPTAEWLPWKEADERRRMIFARLGEDDYRKAPFLGDRGVNESTPMSTLDWADVRAAIPNNAPRDARWIFHISHCGSTLLARLIGAASGALVLREPNPLLNLILPRFRMPPDVDALRALYSRPFRPGQPVVVKATSMVTEAATELTGPPAEGGRALFLSMAPEEFLVRQLARPSPEWAARHKERWWRARERVPAVNGLLMPSSMARVISIAWACEASAAEAALAKIGAERAALLDTSALEREPASVLQSTLAALRIDAGSDALSHAIDAVMAKDAKTGRPFDLAQRTAQRESIRRQHAAAIASELRWLEQAARTSRALAAALNRSSA